MYYTYISSIRTISGLFENFFQQIHYRYFHELLSQYMIFVTQCLNYKAYNEVNLILKTFFHAIS